jgi:hypothetical protein
MRSAARLLFVLLATVAIGGCFVGEEIDNASNMLGKDKSHQPPAKAGDAKPGDAKPGAKPGEKGTAVASAGDAAKSVVATGKEWWAKATTLGSEESNPEIAGCKLAGRTEFMLRDDCLARGGTPE